MSELIAAVLIISAVCGIFGLLAWLSDRKQPDPMARYQARWPKTRGFYGPQ